MGILDLVLLAVIVLAVALAGRKVLRDRKQGKTCGGNCASCSGNCHHRKE